MHFAKHYVYTIFTNWRSGIGFVAFLLGLADKFGEPVILPAMWWWVIAVAALLASQAQSYYKVWTQLEALKTPTYNLTLEELIKHVTGIELGNVLQTEGAAQLIDELLTQIQHFAANDRLTVWGTESESWLFQKPPPVKIPSTFWTLHKIDFLSVLKDGKGHTESASFSAKASDPLYGEFVFNKAQVNLLWPKRAKKKRAKLASCVF